jgi:hypothetical protein
VFAEVVAMFDLSQFRIAETIIGYSIGHGCPAIGSSVGTYSKPKLHSIYHFVRLAERFK